MRVDVVGGGEEAEEDVGGGEAVAEGLEFEGEGCVWDGVEVGLGGEGAGEGGSVSCVGGSDGGGLTLLESLGLG